MKPSDKTMKRFYQELGKIFYSVAATDKRVREEEISQLKQIVKKEWLPFENSIDEFGTDSAYQIEIVFDWLVENDWDTEQALSDFRTFRKEHESLFTKKINTLILKTTKAIAASFLGKNKSEQILINQLDSILT